MVSAKDKSEERILVEQHSQGDGITVYRAQNNNAWVWAKDPVDTYENR